MLLRRTFLTVTLVALSYPAFAQGHSHAAPNGGQIVNIGKLEAELVARNGEISLFLTAAKDMKVDAASYSASAVVLAKGNEQKTVELTPSGDNRLAGKLDFVVDGRFRATVTLKGRDGEIGKGRYNTDIKR